MSNWRTMGVRLKEEEVAVLNQRLKQLGYSSLNEFVGGIADGVIANKQLVEELANTLADTVVNKLLTSDPVLREQPQAMRAMRSLGFEPRLPASWFSLTDQGI